MVDTEIWPNTLRLCHRRGIPVALVNGRISTRSFGKYKLIAPLLARVFRNYSLLLMNSEVDAQRIRELGAPEDKVLVSGNIKYDQNTTGSEVPNAKRDALAKAFALDANHGRLIVAGSTHDPEEEILLAAFTRLRQEPGLNNVRLMIAPRHAERFSVVENLARAKGYTVCRRSGDKPDPAAQVLLIDTLGELAAAYQFADIAFVGGTLIPHGGHSIMEPAIYGKPIIIGQSMANFPSVAKDFLAASALWQIQSLATDSAAQEVELFDAFRTLLTDSERRRKMGDGALSIFEKSRGATAYTVDAISALLAPQTPSR
jgi:3-deoxy-D-manno-octulosonic-acid transferase